MPSNSQMILWASRSESHIEKHTKNWDWRRMQETHKKLKNWDDKHITLSIRKVVDSSQKTLLQQIFREWANTCNPTNNIHWFYDPSLKHLVVLVQFLLLMIHICQMNLYPNITQNIHAIFIGNFLQIESYVNLFKFKIKSKKFKKLW